MLNNVAYRGNAIWLGDSEYSVNGVINSKADGLWIAELLLNNNNQINGDIYIY
jgi:hypothetical protein